VKSTTQVDVAGDTPATTNPGLDAMNAFADNSAGTVSVPVVLGGPSGLAQGVPVTVNYSTANGSAVAGTDYTKKSGMLTFAPGEIAQNITVPILSRPGAAPACTFSVNLSARTNATIVASTATVTIGASGGTALASPGISAPANEEVGGAAGYVDLPVTLSAPGQGAVSVNWATSDGTGSGEYAVCEYANSTYEGGSGTIVFTPGVTLQTVRIPVLYCGHASDYTFTMNLSGNSSDSHIPDSSVVITVQGVPSITKATPASGPVGTSVTVIGANLENAIDLAFNGVKAPIISDAASQLKVTVPSGATTGPITVITPGGTPRRHRTSPSRTGGNKLASSTKRREMGDGQSAVPHSHP
jgi:hypothetical protein